MNLHRPLLAFSLAMLTAPLVSSQSRSAPGLAAVPGPAIVQIASRIATDLAGPAQESVIFVAPLRSDEPAPRGSELVGKLGGLVAGALGRSSSARPTPVPLSTAQALARGAKSLVYLQAEIAQGQLRLTADVYRATRNLWDRARQSAPAPFAHSFASARIDAEVRSYLAPVAVLANHIERAATEERDTVAIACGDIDEDGSLEIVTLSRRRATLGRVRGGRFVPLKIATLRDLSAIAPAPLREPVGSIALVPSQGQNPAHVDLGITDRARGSRFDSDFRVSGTITGIPFTSRSGDVCATFQGSTLAVTLAKCAEGDAPIDPSDIETPLDAVATGSFVLPDGSFHTIAARRDPRTAELHLRSDEQVASLAHSGAQVALADLDQDGSPEIISTLDVPAKAAGANGGADDALVITTWRPGSSPREVVRTPVPGGVRAVAVCPPDGASAAPIVLATQGELWVVR